VSGRSVAVIGGGVSGRSAALGAADFGLEVLLFEQFELPPEFFGSLTVERSRRIRVFDWTPVWALFRGWTVAASRHGEPVVEQVDAVILATGSINRALPFAGGSQPGVITATALRRLIDIYRLLPGQRFVVIGDGEAAQAAVDRIMDADGEIVLRVSEAMARSMTAYGPEGIERVVYGDRNVEADIVVVATGRIPDVTLAASAECELIFNAKDQAWSVNQHSNVSTSVEGIWAAGDIAGCVSEEGAEVEGWHAAARVAQRLGCLESFTLDMEYAFVGNQRSGSKGVTTTVSQPWVPELAKGRERGA
jgi:NAD(P)H-nitrite reductase large subunit